MIGNKDEEEKKDDVLQQINDALEKENWGGNCEVLIFRVVFSGRFQIQSICGTKKFDND